MLEDSIAGMEKALQSAQMMIFPGGFSFGDEPEGSGKFIAAFMRNPILTERIHELLYKHDGLILGICNGFQALIKLGLVPYGKIVDTDASSLDPDIQPHWPSSVPLCYHQNRLGELAVAVSGQCG